MLNKKSKYGEIYTKSGWKKVNDKILIDYLTKRGYQIYRNLSEIHKDEIKGRYIDSDSSFQQNFLNGNINDDTHTKMKNTVTKSHQTYKKQTREELEDELSRELEI